MWLLWWISALSAAQVLAKPSFRFKIPNGDNVPNWKAVGHITPDAKDDQARNPFGVDFDHQKHTWTTTLCMMDSDNDGKSNGDELGDPDCVWKPSDTPRRLTYITNPGVFNDFTKETASPANSSTKFSTRTNSSDSDGGIEAWKVAHA